MPEIKFIACPNGVRKSTIFLVIKNRNNRLFMQNNFLKPL